jgi:hypothetical protein
MPRFCSYCGGALSSTSTPEFDTPTGSISHSWDGSTLSPPEAAAPIRHHEVGQQVGGYRLTRKIGAGAMGSVYEAEHPGSNQRVAIKLIAPEIAMSRTAVERFRLEGKLASTIAHPRCVFVLAADEDMGQQYIVMELMPGATLSTHVAERGPLSPQEAIRKILDVIDGLNEAHRLGVIHRDVKPSNCFIDERGRVKVGDFGLAKSVEGEGELTLTGTFVGTVLFASPEQIKRLPLDAQSDVYSVCATLYYLLTGKPPFHGGDALSSATRIVTESAPSMRTLRPDLPAGLDRVVLKGLDRDKGKRWADLESLREALIRFLPGQHSFGGLGSRFVAHLVDWLVRSALIVPIAWTLAIEIRVADSTSSYATVARYFGFDLLMSFGIWCAYYAIPEGIWGISLGKWLMRLRVNLVDGVEPPGISRSLRRTLASFATIHLGQIAAIVVLLVGMCSVDASKPFASARWIRASIIFIEPIGYLAGIALMCCTMRTRNGYRGLHEFASGTRVLELPPRKRRRRRFADIPFNLKMFRPEGLPEHLGRFEVLGAVRWHENDRSLVGLDPSLNRQVWITMRKRANEDPDRHRQEITRPTRIRWLAAGHEEGWSWDAYLAPGGVPLPSIIAQEGRLPWVDAEPILAQLADELTAACDDESVPEILSPYQVWIDEGGRMQLLGTPLIGDETTVTSPDVSREAKESSEQRSLQLLREVTGCLLEGQALSAERRRSFRSPIPRFASACVNRLFPSVNAFGSPREMRNELRRIADRPADVSYARRAGHLIAFSVFMLSTIGGLLAIATLSPFVEDLVTSNHRELLAEMERVQERDLAIAQAQPDPAARNAGLGVYEDDRRLYQDLKNRIDLVLARREARLEAMSSPVRNRLKLSQQPNGATTDEELEDRDIRSEVREAILESSTVEPFVHMVQWICLLAGPAAWIVWSFLTRGGLSLRFLDLELIREDGRRAARWQCALRSVIFWTPLVALWGISIWLDQYYWSHWYEAGNRQSLRWMAEVSRITWWSASVMLAGYFVVAIWRPQQSWHDRLAGTWLMPR